jgi:hypothetical protein
MEDDAHEFLENHSILKVARSTCEEGTPMQRIFQPLTIEMALPQPR